MKTLKAWIDQQQSFGADRELYALAADGWLISDVSRNRDSDCLDESNFACVLDQLGGESDTVQVLRFGHWAVGWTEWIAFLPEHTSTVEGLESRLEDYPILDEDDHSEREHKAACEVWRTCYDPRERIEYIRKHRSQFEFRGMADLLGCVRGHYFAGYDNELIS